MKDWMIDFSEADSSGFARFNLGCIAFTNENFLASSVFFSKNPSVMASPSRHWTPLGKFSANLE
jgi:hypothetical protein